MDQEEYDAYPDKIEIREFKVAGNVYVTTFLESKKYPKKVLAEIYKRRWDIEIDLKYIKEIMGMDVLSCKTPDMVKKEIGVHFLAYNFIRIVMVEACMKHDALSWRISFKGTLQLVNEFMLHFLNSSAFASALLLYGLSLIYGASGSLSLAALPTHYSLMALTGIIFVTPGLAFKLGATPFHLWVADVYEGAPVSAVNLIASAPKIAVLIILIRLFSHTFVNYSAHWHAIWIAISIASMALGNIAAIIQNNIRRMLAYSAIAHMGYMLLGFISG